MPPNMHSNKLKDPNKIYPAFILFQFLLQKCEVEKSSKQFRAVFKWFHGRVASQVMIYIIITPGIVNRTFENRTQSNTRLSVSSISERIKFNRTNRTKSNSIHLIVFDWVRFKMDCLWLALPIQSKSKSSPSKQVFLIYSITETIYKLCTAVREQNRTGENKALITPAGVLWNYYTLSYLANLQLWQDNSKDYSRVAIRNARPFSPIFLKTSPSLMSKRHSW